MIRKTAAITAASLAGVILAGGAAIGANIGILNAADDSALGKLSAQSTMSVPDTQPASPASSVIVSTTAVASTTPGAATQSFAIDAAGTVGVRAENGALTLDDVRTNSGWSWQERASDANTVAVEFSAAGDAVEFVAVLNDDGTIAARVDRPVFSTAAAEASAIPPRSPGAVAANPTHSDDSYEDNDRYGEDGDEDHEQPHSSSAHEGRDDDD